MVVAGAAKAAGGILDILGIFGRGGGGRGHGVGGREKKGAAAAVSATDDTFDFSALEDYLLNNGPEACHRPSPRSLSFPQMTPCLTAECTGRLSDWVFSPEYSPLYQQGWAVG